MEVKEAMNFYVSVSKNSNFIHNLKVMVVFEIYGPLVSLIIYAHYILNKIKCKVS